MPNAVQNSTNQKCDPSVWVERYGDSLYRYALIRLRNRERAEEVVQETFLAALQARDKFAGNSSERTWMIGILKHKIIDTFRRMSRETPVGDDLEMIAQQQDEVFNRTDEWPGHWKEEEAPSDWGSNPEAALQQREFREVFARCLSELPAKMAQAFVLREMEEMSTEEVCETLNISKSNLWVMLHRARMQLRRRLEVSYFARKGEAGHAFHRMQEAT